MSSDSILHAEFVYQENVATHSLTKTCAKTQTPLNLVTKEFITTGTAANALAVDLVASLAAKAAESLIDATAARMQAEAVTLEATIPLDGLYRADGSFAIDQGCLVFYDRDDQGADPGEDCSIQAVLQVDVSPDATAFRFTVRHWRRRDFLRKNKSFFQRDGERDFALKIEFLTPGTEGLGTRAVFIERVFTFVDRSELNALFKTGQRLPWFAVPRRPTPSAGTAPATKVMPLNLRVTLVETTKPNQFALWMEAVAKEKKAEISTLVKDAVRQAVDPSFAATQVANRADAAGSAFALYKAAWDELTAHRTTKPKLAENATPEQKAAHEAALGSWLAKFAVKSKSLEAKKVIAKVAFDAAELPWQGPLPEITAE